MIFHHSLFFKKFIMGIRNIAFQLPMGTTIMTQIDDAFTLKDFTQIIANRIGPDYQRYRFVVHCKELNLANQHVFDSQKHLLMNGVTIYVLERMLGGNKINALIQRIEAELPIEIQNLRKDEAVCAVCDNHEPTIFLCHIHLCMNCLSHHFINQNYILKCLECSKVVEPQALFTSISFIKLLNELHHLQNRLNTIDCQDCVCGQILYNDTLYAKQHCKMCKRWLCFFCNKDWDDNTMKNAQYTCHNNCYYETKLSFELFPCHYNKSLMVPNRRCCPRCLTLGAFGGHCKYHCCPTCRYKFCFTCLESDEDCQRKYKSNYRSLCTSPKSQDYSIFPR